MIYLHFLSVDRCRVYDQLRQHLLPLNLLQHDESYRIFLKLPVDVHDIQLSQSISLWLRQCKYLLQKV